LLVFCQKRRKNAKPTVLRICDVQRKKKEKEKKNASRPNSKKGREERERWRLFLGGRKRHNFGADALRGEKREKKNAEKAVRSRGVEEKRKTKKRRKANYTFTPTGNYGKRVECLP